MNIFLVILLAMALIIVLLRRKWSIGVSVFVAALFMWACVSRDPMNLVEAFKRVLTMQRTYDLLFALYFVVCLEIELRKSGALSGMIDYLMHLVPSTRLALCTMPAFLGFLPSVGGARFSAPFIQELAEGHHLTPERKAGINFWFRHIMEFANPIVPGMILTCSIVNISVGDLILHLLWVSASMAIIGWFILIHPLKIAETRRETKPIDVAHCRVDFLLALSPIFMTLIFSVGCHFSAAISTGLSVALLYPVLILLKRPVKFTDIFLGAIEKKLFRDVSLILYFIQVLEVSGILALIVHSFDASPLPVPVIMAVISFIVGMLTGLSQGHIAIMMPIVAAIVAPGDLGLIGVAFVFGVGGQMCTPTHVCLTVTLDYFKADFFKTLAPCLLGEALLLALFSGVTYLTW